MEVTVALSEYEQEVLDQMERQLMSDDPKLATAMTQKQSHSFRQYLIAGMGVVAGITVLVSGAGLQIPVLGVAGYLIMFAAVMYVISVKPAGRTRQVPTKPKRPSLQDLLAERWDRRQGGSN